MTILEVLADRASRRGSHPFLRHEGRTLAYAEVDRASNRAAHALRDAGVVRGDRVTLALGNSLEYVVAAFAVLKAGAILNPVNPALGGDELGYVLGHAAPRLVVTDEASDAKLRGLGQRTTLGAALAAASGSDAPLDLALTPGDYSTLLYTSGTTGARARAARTSSRRSGSAATTRFSP